MNVETTRFGTVEVDESRIIEFPSGLLGFSDAKRFALLQPDDEGVFFWLQSVGSPELAFVVTDPSLWVKDYEVPIRREQMDELSMDHLKDAQVFVIVNKRDQLLTGNLQGPLVIHCDKRVGEQLVLSDRRFNTRVPLIELGTAVHAASA